ncbi:MAG TPA: hypothetical protein VF530_15440 [Planctomycetota bacterium]
MRQPCAGGRRGLEAEVARVGAELSGERAAERIDLGVRHALLRAHRRATSSRPARAGSRGPEVSPRRA